MSHEQLTDAAMALPVSDRAALAQRLWASLNDELPLDSNGEAVEETALQRSVELSSGAVLGRDHAEVFAAARRAIECD